MRILKLWPDATTLSLSEVFPTMPPHTYTIAGVCTFPVSITQVASLCVRALICTLVLPMIGCLSEGNNYCWVTGRCACRILGIHFYLEIRGIWPVGSSFCVLDFMLWSWRESLRFSLYVKWLKEEIKRNVNLERKRWLCQKDAACDKRSLKCNEMHRSG